MINLAAWLAIAGFFAALALPGNAAVVASWLDFALIFCVLALHIIRGFFRAREQSRREAASRPRTEYRRTP